MIYELNNIKDIENSFINKEEVEKELNNNPFGKYLLLKENNDLI